MKERYPFAQWLGNGKSGGTYIGVPWKVVLHTTETKTIPGYRLGFTAPHLTYYPLARQWVQHTSLYTAARALKRVSTQTNRANALQVEIVCYSSLPIAQSVNGLWVAELSMEHTTDLANFVDWCGAEFGVEQKWPLRQAFSYAQANVPGFRLSSSQWLAYNGVLGHQHVPTNEHWDPGALAWNRVIGDTVIVRPGARGNYVRPYQQALNKWGQTVAGWVPLAEDGIYGPDTTGAVSRYQAAAEIAGIVPQPGALDDLTRDLLERYVES